MERKDNAIHDASTQTNRFSEAALTLACCTDEKKNRLAFRDAGFEIKGTKGNRTVILNEEVFAEMETHCVPDEEETAKERNEGDLNPSFGFINRQQFPTRWAPKFK